MSHYSVYDKTATRNKQWGHNVNHPTTNISRIKNLVDVCAQSIEAKY